MATKAVSKPLTYRQVLRVIDRTLSCGGAQAEGLWAVLTALRGPDNGGHTLKLSTTAVIRTAAFPRTAKRGGEMLAMFAPKGERYANFGGDHIHFHRHANEAAAVLGLTTAMKKA